MNGEHKFFNINEKHLNRQNFKTNEFNDIKFGKKSADDVYGD